MKDLQIDGILFHVDNFGVSWDRPEPVPLPWVDLAVALAAKRFQVTDDNRVLVIVEPEPIPLRSEFVDSHDADGKAVVGGRRSGLYFDVKVQPDGDFDPGDRFLTGHVDGKPFVSMLK